MALRNSLKRFVASHLMWATLLLGFLLNMLPMGQTLWWPDVLLIFLMYWVMHYPGGVGLGTGFLLGLVMDVQSGSLLGQHAFAYVLSCYIAVTIHRRLLWFRTWSQGIRLFPFFLVVFVCTLGLRLMLGGDFPGSTIFLVPFLQALLWPVCSQLLTRMARWSKRVQQSSL